MSSCNFCCCWSSEESRWRGPIGYVKLPEKGATSYLELSEGRVVSVSEVGSFFVPPGRYVPDKDEPENPFIFAEVEERKTGTIYWGESQAVVAFKALVATATGFLVVWTILNIAARLFAKLPINLLNCVWTYASSMKKAGGCGTGLRLTGRLIVDLLKEMAESVWFVVRSPFYAAAMQVGLLYTLFFPYQGRAVTAAIERGWCRADATQDFRYTGDPRCLSFAEIHQELNQMSYFLFFCYQPHIKSKAEDASYVQLKDAPNS